ncbi:TPA: hypothetical protein DIV55_01495 [Patescibacteria group bacterium]|uniref:Uncharacterized protein n=1 Tax=Candidatus Gottesmanbacteria bacterium GW2011_GWA1_43_11 TaxID=1618436 RepID=A0A0G1CGU9_9BACT|nr:MAG: hypothetical protein UV59_C0015G0007 [Candidatus Gottesmanbacteria bacterium GW2011_GWA1_43_11]HCS78397.1 hypothetical protein [Patescibacteria group bacterium]
MLALGIDLEPSDSEDHYQIRTLQARIVAVTAGEINKIYVFNWNRKGNLLGIQELVTDNQPFNVLKKPINLDNHNHNARAKLVNELHLMMTQVVGPVVGQAHFKDLTKTD